jgi:hypothetical protein
MEPEAMAANPTSVTVDDDGDLILLVGPDDAQAQILVSSKALTLASSVFRAMLSKTTFKEGRELVKRYERSTKSPFMTQLFIKF